MHFADDAAAKTDDRVSPASRSPGKTTVSGIVAEGVGIGVHAKLL